MILGRLRNQAENQVTFNKELNRFVSRMYRLDDTVGEIVPGKMDQMNIDFSEPAKNRKYLFHKIRPTGIG